MQPHWAQKGADRATEQSSVLSLSERSIRLVPLTPVPWQRMGYAKKNPVSRLWHLTLCE
jgi:hypothetical protein